MNLPAQGGSDAHSFTPRGCDSRRPRRYEASYDVSKLGPLDERFYGLDENLSALRIAKIRASPELFSGD